MGKQIEKLTAVFIRQVNEPGWYGDGGNLWLQVTPQGSKSWLFRYKIAGRTRALGLGASHTVSLAKAREKAREMRQQLLDGVDPGAARAERKAQQLHTITFGEACTRYIDAKRSEWGSAKHADQWENTLKTYCATIYKRQVREIQIADVLACLEPIWQGKTVTATRVQQRIARVLDWATVGGFRSGDNPARWKGLLDNLLANPSKVAKKENHPSLPYARMPAFMVELRKHEGMGAFALDFLILTAARSGEVRGATWAEIEGDLWTIPAERMKAGVEHVVPLSDAALALLDGLPRFADTNLMFPSVQAGKTISDMTMTKLLRTIGWRDEKNKVITAHGFRSTFRMWAAEQSDASREVAEHALSHKLPDKVEAAYQRGTLLNKRVKLMQQWADFLKG